MSLPGLNPALSTLLDRRLEGLAASESLPAELIRAAIQAGTMVLLGNPAHPNLTPLLVGQPSRIKVNANIGVSPFICDPKIEMDKLRVALEAGADTVMDLSTAGDLDAIRLDMLKLCALPLGTVPIYSVAQRYIDKKQDPAKLGAAELLDEIAKQAEQGVDFMTLHTGVTERAARLAAEVQPDGSNRLLGIVSRGGAILARWMRERKQENPLLTHYDELLKICAANNVTISLGDGLRPGAGADAGDAAQWAEVATLAECAANANAAGVQVMIEGPGHVPLHLVQSQIQGIKRLCNNAPLYVLGPLVTDSAAGHDHIGAAIGGALAGLYGADFLCYVTPAEHLTLPGPEDVRLGVMASRVAAHSAEVALGKPQAVARDRDISQARKTLDWDAIGRLALDPKTVSERRDAHKHERECAMCGKFCAIKMLELEK
jgi:phosphomethylpyrimidine synthase